LYLFCIFTIDTVGFMTVSATQNF